MKDNYRESKCCFYCRHSTSDFYNGHIYCTLINEFPKKLNNVELIKFAKENEVGEHQVCDDFV